MIDNKPAISIITEIELLCWNALKEQDMFILKQFISGSVIYELNESIKLKTIEIRKHYKLKLPDAIIAASALVNNHVLISRNASDFKKIEGLTLLDPFNLNQ